MSLNPEQLERYARQILLPQLGEAGQERVAQSSVLLIGCGGLGSAVSLYLAAAGIGRIGLVEFDIVDLSNLQRQILHDESALGHSKIASAAARLKALNSSLVIDSYEGRFSPERIDKSYDLVLDASDNFQTRLETNAYAQAQGILYVVAAVFGFIGQLSVFEPQGRPCYQCHVGSAPPQPEGPMPIMGAVAGAMGALQALEALKLLAGIPSHLSGKILEMDMLSHRQRILSLPPNPACEICGKASNL